MDKSFQFEDEHYPFEKPNSSKKEYTFQTQPGVIYRVVFKPSPYIFGEDKPYASLLFEFSLLVQAADASSYRRDDLIPPTVAAIFLDFYHRNDQNVCFYICDSSDGKQRVRARKFTAWFKTYNFNEKFVKEDGELKDLNDIVYPVSIIMAKNNRYYDEIKNAFVNLIDGYNNEK